MRQYGVELLAQGIAANAVAAVRCARSDDICARKLESMAVAAAITAATKVAKPHDPATRLDSNLDPGPVVRKVIRRKVIRCLRLWR